MKTIGGFFELALRKEGSLYHDQALAFNSGSSALAFYLQHHSFNKILVPYYTCSTVFNSMQNNNIVFDRYRIDENFQPLIDCDLIDNQTLLIYNNYFGINNKNIDQVLLKADNVLIDASQSFFYQPRQLVDYFNSVRKFFGVPDGGFLNFTVNQQRKANYHSLTKTDYIVDHLFRRIEDGPEKAYHLYKQSEGQLMKNPVGKMSELTKKLLRNQDFQRVKENRISNFKYLDKALSSFNQLKLDFDLIDANDKDLDVPICYPLLIQEGKKIKQALIENKIFVPTYWPNISSYFNKDCNFEQKLVDDLVCLPIDQRYDKADMKIITDFFNEQINE